MQLCAFRPGLHPQFCGSERLFLIDPVFSDYGALFAVFNQIFPGTDLYIAEDMPTINYLIISHDDLVLLVRAAANVFQWRM